MAEESSLFEKEDSSGASDKTKKNWQLNALILAGVFLLSVVLPPEYKGFAPLLFLVPFIINVASKIRRAEENPFHSSRQAAPPPQIPGHPMRPTEPYSYKQKNPKDPRKYKPIG